MNSIDQWLKSNTFHHGEFWDLLKLIRMKEEKGIKISLCIPTLNEEKTIVLAAGSIISAVGGAIGTFIAKTFLDVHKLSLNQLNKYFKQPVINEHILMAQRLADDSGDPETKKKAYQTIIDSIASLIRQESPEKN